MSTPLEIVVKGNVNEATSGLKSVQAELGKTVLAAQKTDSSLQRLGTSGSQSLALLTTRLDVLKSAMFNEHDISKIAGYNKQIEGVEKEIARLSNAGKSGFNDLGDAITKSTGSPLTKAFSGLRTLANIIPGIGIAGIIAFATGPIIEWVESLLKASDATNTAKENLENLSAVISEANKEAGKQTATLKLLYDAATSVNLSMKDRLAAVKGLQDQFPEFFANISKETILNGGAKNAYDALTVSILATSRAKAAKAKIDELESKRLDNEFQKQKVINATNAEIARARQKNVNVVTATDEFGNAVGVNTVADQIKVIEVRRKAALDAIDINNKSLQAQEDFLTKFATLPSIAKVIEDGIKTDTPKAAKAAKKAKQKVVDELKTVSDITTPSAIPPIEIPVTVAPLDKEDLEKQIEALLNRVNIFEKAKKGLEDFQQEVADTILNMQSDLASGIGETLGKALGGDRDAFKGLFTNLFSSVGAQLQALGKFLIESAVKVQIAKKAFVKLLANPVAAIAVGIGLVALGALIKQAAGKEFPGFAGGVKNFRGGLAIVGEKGPELVTLPRGSSVIPNNQLGSTDFGTQIFIPELRIEGQDLIVVFNRAQASNRRNF